jgi:outer membrane murein-binding lipoprotein Lpp
MANPNAQFPAQNIITDQGVYPFSALLAVIKRLIAALFGAGASTVVWRPGAVSSGNVFGTWAEVVTAVAALNGAIRIVVDMDAAAAVIPAGAWDLRPAGTSGPVMLVAGGQTTPYFSQFVTIANAVVAIHGLTGLDGIQIVNQATSNVITISAALEQEEFVMYGYAAIYQAAAAGAANAFLRVNNFSGALSLNGSSFVSTLDAGTNAVQVAAGAFLQVIINDNSTFDTNQLVAPAGTAIVVATGEPSPPFVSYGTQAGAPTIIPTGLTQSGIVTLAGGASAAIAVFLGASSRIVITPRDGNGTDAATAHGYAVLPADRVNGAPGSIIIRAFAGAVAAASQDGANAATVEFLIKN